MRKNQKNPPSNNENKELEVISNEELKPKVKKKKSTFEYKWILIVFILSFSLGAFFSFLSELMLGDATLVAVIIVLTVLLFINIFFDIIGLAFACAKPEPLIAMSTRKIRGAKEALKLLKKANRVSSICQDVMGDICGIISGAAGATAVVIIASNSDTNAIILASVIISGLISAFTIAGKASTKRLAMQNSTSIVLFVGKFLSLFRKQK